MKFYRQILILVTAMWSLNGFDIVNAETWERTYGGSGTDQGRSVQQTNDGGYVIAGWTNSVGAGDYDVYLIKTDGAGNQIWEKTFGGVGSDRGHKVKQTSDLGYIILAETESFGNGKVDSPDIWLIKTDSFGNKQWDKTFGGNYDDYGSGIEQTADGGYILAGSTRLNESSPRQAYVVRTQPNGNLIWEKRFEESTARAVQVVSATNYAILGTKYVNYNEQIFLKILNNDGVVVGGNESISEGFGSSIQRTADGGYIVAGMINSTGSTDNLALLKLDPNYNLSWRRTFWEELDPDVSPDVFIDSDGGFRIAVQTTDSKIMLMKTDPSGRMIWRVFLNDSTDWMRSTITDNGTCIVVDSIYSQQSGSTDVYLLYYLYEGNASRNLFLPALPLLLQ
jgi:hypothetical protein